MIVTFLALLEMIRLKLVRVFQSGSFGPIRVYKRARPADAPHPMHDPEAEYEKHHAHKDEGRETKDEGRGRRTKDERTTIEWPRPGAARAADDG